MCGIILLLSRNSDSNTNLLEVLQTFLEGINRRGPDSIGIEKHTTDDNINLVFAASVLWLQGDSICRQPISNNKSIFIYNGDIFHGIPDEYRTKHGDTKYIFDLLNQTQDYDICNTLSTLQGPYAFTFYDKVNNKIYFGRDKFGRRSMLIGINANTVALCSVAKRTKNFEFMELPSVGIFVWDIHLNELVLYPFTKNRNFERKLEELEQFLKQHINVIDTYITIDTHFQDPTPNQIHIFESILNLSIENAFSVLLNNSEWFSKVSKLHTLLENSLSRRLSGQPKFCKVCIKGNLKCNHCIVGVLFSGGVDCSILALLSDKFVERDRAIDLFNVSFDEINGYNSPDRLTGLETLEELRLLCPERKWRFIQLNITKKELDEERQLHIADLIYPLKSILDDSLGCALWFASRGRDDSHCRVLLVGMGADELFGGYTKHRAAFKRESWLGLHNILSEDWQNLPYRNLARDDRVVSDHGKQLRTPYLDENLVNFVSNLQCWEKSYPSDNIPHGFGDKILLRSLAYHLGLKKAAVLKKRALQFGSRIADKKEVANNISSRLC